MQGEPREIFSLKIISQKDFVSKIINLLLKLCDTSCILPFHEPVNRHVLEKSWQQHFRWCREYRFGWQLLSSVH